MKTEITVLMPVFNGERYIREAIESVLNQTLSDFEFLIINDGSTDQTESIIKSYNDSRIRLINRKNGGVSKALNEGLKLASGTYIARFDADDICYPRRLEEQYNYMISNNDCVIVGSDADYIDKEGEYIFSLAMPGHLDDEIRETSISACPFIHSSVMYKRNVVIDCGSYELKAHGFEDYFLWVKLIKKGKIFNFNYPMIKVRFNPESVTIDSKDYPKTYLTLHKKALHSGEITDEEEKEILKSIKKIGKKQKEISYNRMLGKKYLWDNYNPGKARAHLLKSIKSAPFNYQSYVLFMLSFFSKKFISSLYNNLK